MRDGGPNSPSRAHRPTKGSGPGGKVPALSEGIRFFAAKRQLAFHYSLPTIHCSLHLAIVLRKG